MSMTADGFVKVIEECGEVLQVAGKRLAYFHGDHHPDGGPALPERLGTELADLLAACDFVVEQSSGGACGLHEIRLGNALSMAQLHQDPGDTAGALIRLIGTCGDLASRCAQTLSDYRDPVGPPAPERFDHLVLSARFEVAQATAHIAIMELGLNQVAIDERRARKLAQFRTWHVTQDNDAAAFYR